MNATSTTTTTTTTATTAKTAKGENDDVDRENVALASRAAVLARALSYEADERASARETDVGERTKTKEAYKNHGSFTFVSVFTGLCELCLHPLASRGEDSERVMERAADEAMKAHAMYRATYEEHETQRGGISEWHRLARRMVTFYDYAAKSFKDGALTAEQFLIIVRVQNFKSSLKYFSTYDYPTRAMSDALLHTFTKYGEDSWEFEKVLQLAVDYKWIEKLTIVEGVMVCNLMVCIKDLHHLCTLNEPYGSTSFFSYPKEAIPVGYDTYDCVAINHQYTNRYDEACISLKTLRRFMEVYAQNWMNHAVKIALIRQHERSIPLVQRPATPPLDESSVCSVLRKQRRVPR